jgi:hypothetical protein
MRLSRVLRIPRTRAIRDCTEINASASGWHALRYSEGRGNACRDATPFGVPQGRSSSPGQLPDRGPRQIRTRRFPPSGSSERMTRVWASATLRSYVDRKHRDKARGLLPSAGSASHGPPLLGRLWGIAPFPGVNARMQPSDSPTASAVAVVPLASGLPWCERFSLSSTRAFADERRAGGVGFGSSAAPK